MTKSVASEDKTEEPRSASLQTATRILQIRERAIRQTKSLSGTRSYDPEATTDRIW
jgi:hypothetical protein